MQALRNGYVTSKKFVSSVVEFRSATSPLYWMVVNSTFWWSVFYLTREYQLKLLVSLAAFIFGWDVLLSSSHHHSPMVHLLLWPFREPIRVRPLLQFLFIGGSLGTALTMFSVYQLKTEKAETACWMAYGSLFLFMINPVLNYQQIPQRALKIIFSLFNRIKSFFVIAIVQPSITTYKLAEYIILLKWTKAIWHWLKCGIIGFATLVTNSYINFISFNRNLMDTIISSITKLSIKFINAIIWVKLLILCSLYRLWAAFVGKIRSLLNGIRNIIVTFCITLQRKVKRCICGVMFLIFNVRDALARCIFGIYNCIYHNLLRVRDAFIATARKIFYIVKNGPKLLVAVILNIYNSVKDLLIGSLLQIKTLAFNFLNGIWQRLYQIYRNIFNQVSQIFRWCLNTIASKLILPVGSCIAAIGSFLVYWCCGYWLLPMKCWLTRNVYVRLKNALDISLFWLIYICCFHWIRPLASILRVCLEKFAGLAFRQLKVIHAALQSALVRPFMKWLKHQFYGMFLLSKRMLREFGLLFKDIVLYPLFAAFVNLAKKVAAYINIIIFEPIGCWLYRKYKICEDYILIYVLAPICTLLVNNIPEKSPFCDDSDVELADFLPVETDQEESTSDKSSTSEESIHQTHSTLDEDFDLMHGLVFPSVEESESSDDEFTVDRKHSKKKHLKKRKDVNEAVVLPKITASDVVFSEEEGQKTDSNNAGRLTPDLQQIQDCVSESITDGKGILPTAESADEFMLTESPLYDAE
uniref:Uncharacterized protein n=1 Tax=Syphacia muris TaxID=451379 RepID=A0A0N5A865_9BILA